MSSEFFTTQMFYLFGFNIMDMIFRMTSEKIINQKVNKYLRESSIVYLKSQFIFDILIISSLFFIVFQFRIHIISNFLDLNLEEQSQGSESLETNNMKLKLQVINWFLYLQFFKINHESLNSGASLMFE
jgi:hypothetical protein